MSTDSFDLDAGALCLDFTNTLEWRNSDDPVEHLKSYADLLSWAEAAGVLSPETAQVLRRAAQKKPEEAVATHTYAIVLREAIYRLFASRSGEGLFDAGDLALLNQAIEEALSHLHVVRADAGFGWDWARGANSFEQVWWPVARSAGDLLTSEMLNRVHQCADDRGCGYLFVDTSRNHSRRWCSMESCGNRAKAQRHYQRQQQAQ